MRGNPLHLGDIIGNGRPLVLPASARERHLYVCGGTGVGNPQARARWIIESVSARPMLAGRRIELGPLTLADLSLILAQVPTNRKADDHEDVAKLAKGNPHRAVVMWQSSDISFATDTLSFAWFRRQLTPLEHQILKVLCVAMSSAPLGISGSILRA